MLHWKVNSLRGRLTTTTCITLSIFLGLTGFILETAFTEAMESNIAKVQESKIYALVGVADDSNIRQLQMPMTLTEEDLNDVTSGVYGLLYNSDKEVIWRSPSVIEDLPKFTIDAPTGAMNFYSFQDNTIIYYVTSFAVEWYGEDKKIRRYVFLIAENASRYQEIASNFRQSLWLWFSILILALIAFQLFILTWGFKPLQKVIKAIAKVEQGLEKNIQGNYPKEIRKLTDAINLLIKNEQQQGQRYRDSLADLAHSLKTPLAVIRSTLENHKIADNLHTNLDEQLNRMNQIIASQLQRAKTAGKTTFSTAILVSPTIEKIVLALKKVYRHKNMEFTLNLQEDAKFWGEEADLLEFCGNIIENASKYGQKKVEVCVEQTMDSEKGSLLSIICEDDGPGVEKQHKNEILQRGKRLDEQTEGQGLGLSIVVDIVSSYNGQIKIERSYLGGAKFVLTFITNNTINA
ncbi:MAG: ATP-binding protein [Pseudomonadota bacterium]